jgi:hypothetical protein
MEEMNTNGFMIGDTYASFFPAQDATVKLMQMLGADGFPESSRYNASAAVTIDTYFEHHKHQDSEMSRRMLERFIHMDMHGGDAWQRSFPPPQFEYFDDVRDTRNHSAHGEVHEGWNEKVTPRVSSAVHNLWHNFSPMLAKMDNEAELKKKKVCEEGAAEGGEGGRRGRATERGAGTEQARQLLLCERGAGTEQARQLLLCSQR